MVRNHRGGTYTGGRNNLPLLYVIHQPRKTLGKKGAALRAVSRTVQLRPSEGARKKYSSCNLILINSLHLDAAGMKGDDP